MKTPKFEKNMILRMINTLGVDFPVYRNVLDEFKEPTDKEVIAKGLGVFHRVGFHVSVMGNDASSVQSKKTPYILMMYDMAKEVRQGDFVFINGKKFLVTGCTNIGEWDIAIDISLEEEV